MIADLRADDRVVLADLEAGVLELVWVKPEPGTVVLVVTSPDRGPLMLPPTLSQCHTT
jgi:hypothetical protein